MKSILAICVLLAFSTVRGVESDTARGRTWIVNFSKLTSSSWRDCSTNSDPMFIQTVDLQSPVKKGTDAYITIKATFGEQVNGGKLIVQMRYANIIPLPRKQYSLCDVLKNSDVDCPVETGDHVITFSVSVPSYVPSGQYTGRVIARDEYGKELTCIHIYQIRVY